MAVLLKHGEKLGCSKENMLSFGDRESNSPLHSAVNSGDYNVRNSLVDRYIEFPVRGNPAGERRSGGLAPG